MQSKSLFDVTVTDWENEVLKSEKLVVVLFWAKWCPHCKALMPIFQDLSKEYVDKMKFAKLNVEEYKDIAEGYGIMGVPTMKFFCGGKPISDLVGRLSKDELRNIFNSMIAVHKKCLATSSPIYYV